MRRVELVLDPAQHVALLADLLAEGLAVLLRLGGLELGLELVDLPLGLADALHGLAQPLDQAALDRLRELDALDGLRHRHAQAAQLPLGLDVLGLALADLHELLAVLQVLVVRLRHLGGELQRLLDLVLDLLLGDLFLVEDHHVAHGELARAQALGQPRHLLRGHGRAGDDAHDGLLAALDALGDLDLALAREQRHRPHLAQVHADGVVRLVQGARGEVELGAFLALLGFPELLLRVDDLDPHLAEHGEDVVQLVRGADLGRQHLVHLFVKEIALLLSHGDELSDLVVLFFDRQRHSFFSPLVSACRPPPARWRPS